MAAVRHTTTSSQCNHVSSSRAGFGGHSTLLGRQCLCGCLGCGCLASEGSLQLLHPKCIQAHPDAKDIFELKTEQDSAIYRIAYKNQQVL